MEIDICIRKLGHPYGSVECADIFTNMACHPLEIAIPVTKMRYINIFFIIMRVCFLTLG